MMIMLVVSVRVELVALTRRGLGIESVRNEGLVTCILDCCPAEWDECNRYNNQSITH